MDHAPYGPACKRAAWSHHTKLEIAAMSRTGEGIREAGRGAGRCSVAVRRQP